MKKSINNITLDDIKNALQSKKMSEYIEKQKALKPNMPRSPKGCTVGLYIEAYTILELIYQLQRNDSRDATEDYVYVKARYLIYFYKKLPDFIATITPEDPDLQVVLSEPLVQELLKAGELEIN